MQKVLTSGSGSSKLPTLRDLYAQGKLRSHLDRVSLVKADITKLQVDAIVNAAKTDLLGGGGVDGAIHKAAGPRLIHECSKLKSCETGDAKITNGYDLPAKYIIHTVGPIYDPDDEDTVANQLASCYYASLRLAVRNHAKSIAFPAISTGVYRYPIEDATHIALTVVKRFLESKEGDKIDLIAFVSYSDDQLKIYERIIPKYFPSSA